MTLDVQFMTMISMILGGLYLGMALETFRRLFHSLKNNRLLTYVMEITFWMIQAMILFYILFRVNGGEIRIYSTIASLLGFAAYQAIVAPGYKRLLELTIKVVISVYQLFVNVIDTLIFKPIKLILGFFVTCLLLLLKGIYAILSFILKILVTPVYWTLKKIYKLLPEGIQNIFNKIAGFYSTMENILSKVARFLKNKRR